MCGKETGLFKAVVEGTELKVCKECASFGKVIKSVKPVVIPKRENEVKVEKGPEIIQIISPDYSNKVKKAREALGLKQEEFAKKISEKESVVHKIETGNYKPNLVLAQKLERFLKIKLVEEHKIEKAEKKENASPAEGLTIGDLIKLKK